MGCTSIILGNYYAGELATFTTMLNDEFDEYIVSNDIISALKAEEGFPNKPIKIVGQSEYDRVYERTIAELFPMIHVNNLRRSENKAINIEGKRPHIRRRLSFIECAELYDLVMLRSCNADALIYINMHQQLRLFSRERQMFYRRYNLDFLDVVYKEQYNTPMGVEYKRIDFVVRLPIPFYDDFSHWMGTDIRIITLDRM